MIKKYFDNMKTLPFFEEREGQYDMAKAIDDTLELGHRIIIEAETGIGKTLAYLIPSICYAKEYDRKVVVSTNTINLQEQLINKDLPLLEKIMDKKIKYMIVKGRSNYICRRKAKKYLSEHKLLDISKWLLETKTGDKSELKKYIPNDIWSKICSSRDIVNGISCDCYEECYFGKARRNIEEAEVLIVNHHLFFSDMMLKQNNKYAKILPDYGVLIFDEAHNIENVVRDYLSIEVSREELAKISGSIYNKNNKHGSAIRLYEFLSKILDVKTYVDIEKYKEDILRYIEDMYIHTTEIFNDIHLAVFKNNQNDIEVRKNLSKIYHDNNWKKVQVNKEKLEKEYFEFNKIIKELMKDIEKLNVLEADADGNIMSFDQDIRYFKEMIKNMLDIIEANDERYIYWVSDNPLNYDTRIKATPFDISGYMKEYLFENTNNIVLTSATLTVNNSFEYVKGILGLKDDEYLNEKIIKSPFDYEKNMNIYIPKGILPPNDSGYNIDIAKFIAKYSVKYGGGIFILFTSYKAMREVYDILIDILPEEYTLIKQGELNRNEMINKFKNSKHPILFGTDSFWEGVDIQGDKLNTVIIAKLPFQVPDDPITEAINKKINDEGGSSFIDYQLPYAIIKLKQGVGRLIRSKNDKGNIIIMDNRLITKGYGKKIIKALPKQNVLVDIVENI